MEQSKTQRSAPKVAYKPPKVAHVESLRGSLQKKCCSGPPKKMAGGSDDFDF